METRAAEHLQSLRPDLRIANSRPASEFEQYKHLSVFRTFTRNYKGPSALLSAVELELEKALQADTTGVRSRIRAAAAEAAADHELVMQLSDTMPEESMLKLDITASAPTDTARLLVGLSSKWSLRTDRAQDCVSQGAKLVSLRRGHMPHYAVLTMEPRPSMLKLIAYGSGSVDCVYHVALPELRVAAAEIAATKREGVDGWPPRLMLERMVSQGRVRSYGQLVDEIRRVA
ncbi:MULTISPECIES: NgoMIV family type II restriction endonuclease [unclassified Rhodococcus (in: high G+C Gram-positive bacteria)]|uniref:NgoMIV family type II restriction endonuclease n=1 Tax=Rhodococcus sp. 114MFTsu3.1 TaxID=1172184 RepID=UPI000362AFA3|nr:NgoMIV family type II restriction endonuclease [Rhodococcus sp. 114MFTsu3.1]